MKIPVILFLVWVTSIGSFAQTYDNCGACDKVAKEPVVRNIYDQNKAESEISSLCDEFAGEIIIKARPYACKTNPLFAVICQPSQTNYIFYLPGFIENLIQKNQWGDRFVLSHEISHHVLGHTVRERILNNDMKSYLSKLYRQINFIQLNKKNVRDTTIVNILFRHIQELEADALGLWLAARKGATKEDLIQIFDAMPKLLQAYYPGINKYRSNSNYPSFFHRQKMMEAMFEVYQKANPQANKKNKPTSKTKGYASFYEDEDSKKEFSQDIANRYAFLLQQSSPEELDSLGIKLKKIIRVRNLFAELLMGMVVQYPSFSRKGMEIPSSVAMSPTFGLRIVVGKNFKPCRIETDILWSTNHFKTLAEIDNTTRDIEEFRIQQIQIQPRYVFGNFKSKGEYRSSGMQLGIGPSLQIPVSFKYKTNVTSSPQQPTLKPSVGGAVGAGYWVGRYRIWGSYCYQPLRFKESKPQDIDAVQHGLRVDVSFRF